MRGIDIQCDGGVGVCNGTGTTTKLSRSDGYGLYLGVSSGSCTANVLAPCWKNIVTSASLPVGDPTNTPGVACLNGNCSPWDARIAPSNTNVFYILFNGYVYTTSNRGANWIANASFARDTTGNSNAGGGIGEAGPKIAIDPGNANIAIVCTGANGCFQTTNGGTNWTLIANGIVNSSTLMIVAFDTTTTSGGSTPGIYICSTSHFCYHTTGGVTGAWTALNGTGAPTTFQHLIVDQTGIVWVVDNAGAGSGNFFKFTGGTWTMIFGSDCCKSVAVDPNNAAHIVVAGPSGDTIVTFNSWSSNSGQQTFTTTSTDVPWLAAASGTFLSNGNIVYDPAQSNVLYLSAGQGIWFQNPSTGTSAAYTSQTAGIENLTGIGIVSPPGGNPFLFGWDFQAFEVTNPNTYQTTANRGPKASVSPLCCYAAWNVDYASSSPSTLMAVSNPEGAASGNPDISGVTSNGGTSWTQFGTTPPNTASTNFGGAVAVGSASVGLWITAANGNSGTGQLFATVDGGTSWQLQSISGIATAGQIGWYDNYFLNRSNVCADRVASNTFYAFNYGGSSTAGIYKGVYTGSWAWTRAMTGTFDGNDNNNGALRCVPGNSGDMFWSSGNVTDTNFANYPHSLSFYECTDSVGTVTCGTVANVKEVWCFGFGAAKPGGSGYPSIYIVGWVTQNGGASYQYGVWRSTDHAVTWTNLGIPLNYLDQPVAISGHSDTFGLVYLTYHGSGNAYGQFNFLLKRDIDRGSNDNDPMWLEKAA